MEEKIEISKKEYDNLVSSDMMLEALRATGVDNWQGYGEAMIMYEEIKGS